MAEAAFLPRPFVSVDVPALNCAKYVQSFAEAMRQRDYPADRSEIIAVDNRSSDDTFERARAAAQGDKAARGH